MIRCLGWKEKYSCFRKCGWREKSSPRRPQIYVFYQFEWFFVKNFTLKRLLWGALYWKGRALLFSAGREKKCQFLRINLLVENCLNSEFYWRNFFHYRFKIQSLTWTWHCRSHNLQPASTSEKHWRIWLLKKKICLFRHEGKAL